MFIITFLGFGLQTTYAVNVNDTYVQNIMVQPSAIKVGDIFTVTATLVNNSTIPIVLGGGACVPVSPTEPFFTILFDSHAKVKENDATCAGVGLVKILNPRENLTGTSPDSTLSYIATESGTANATVIFSYHVINQTDPTQPPIQHTISKSFSFLINDNKTSAAIGMKNSSHIIYADNQTMGGIAPTDGMCPQFYYLPQNSTSCKPQTLSPACPPNYTNSPMYFTCSGTTVNPNICPPSQYIFSNNQCILQIQTTNLHNESPLKQYKSGISAENVQ